MRFASLPRRLAAWSVAAALAGALAACGGNSTEIRIIGGGTELPGSGPEVSVDGPQGPNTTELVVDTGPSSGFALGVANLPYVTVTVCEPGSTTACVTVDHVFLDTGSIGLRILRSALAPLALPKRLVGGRTTVECFPFVVGAVWGPVASADVHIAGESAAAIPVQIIDDADSPAFPPTSDCQAAAGGELLRSVTTLQANGVLGVGMLGYDCGLVCDRGDYAGGYVLYYTCDGSDCRPAAVPADEQLRNPVTAFETNNNGTLIVMPAVPDSGASVARGRLVFGIGTQTNNQLSAQVTPMFVQTDPSRDDYLYLSAESGGTRYPYSYVDSGSNGLFFDNAALSTRCAGSGGGASWYCPPATTPVQASVSDAYGTSVSLELSIASADLLFSTSNTAFSNLGGAVGSANPGAFVFGMPLFFGRTVYTAIWGQALAVDGPWYAF